MANPGKPAAKPATKPAAKPNNIINAADILKRAASKTKGPTKRKDEKPVFNVPELHGPIQDFLEAYKNCKDAEAAQAAAEQLILPAAEQERLKFCQANGRNESTVKFQSPAGIVAVNVQNKYSHIDPEKTDALIQVFGEDNFNLYFSSKTEVALNEAAFKDEGVIEKLIAAVGQENFDTYFKVKQYLAVNENYHEARATNPALQSMHEEAVAAELVRHNKASCKPS